jgi:hypothetical protein
MRSHHAWRQCVALGFGLTVAAASHVLAQTVVADSPAPVHTLRVPSPPSMRMFDELKDLPAKVREGIYTVLQRPTLAVQGRHEAFHGQPVLYRWFLDHPDQAVQAWRRLGAKCTDITNLGNGCYRWTDGHGSQVTWRTIHTSAHDRIWYAEGRARPAPLLPMFPVRAVVVLRFEDDLDSSGRPVIRHQMDVFAQTDSKAVKLVTRLLGSSAPRLAENGVTQMEMFYSALVWFLNQKGDE